MSATNEAAFQILQLIFENLDWANTGGAGIDILKSVSDGNFFISLHTSSPGETGDQTTNEASYTGYARVTVARGAAQWTVAAASDPASVDNDNAVTFAECTAGSATVTHFGIGNATSGAGVLHFHGALDASLAISAGVTPEFAAGALNITLD